MNDVGDSYFELQTSATYLLFKFLHIRGYLKKVCGTGHFPLSAVPSKSRRVQSKVAAPKSQIVTLQNRSSKHELA